MSVVTHRVTTRLHPPSAFTLPCYPRPTRPQRSQQDGTSRTSIIVRGSVLKMEASPSRGVAAASSSLASSFRGSPLSLPRCGKFLTCCLPLLPARRSPLDYYSSTLRSSFGCFSSSPGITPRLLVVTSSLPRWHALTHNNSNVPITNGDVDPHSDNRPAQLAYLGQSPPGLFGQSSL